MKYDKKYGGGLLASGFFYLCLPSNKDRATRPSEVLRYGVLTSRESMRARAAGVLTPLPCFISSLRPHTLVA